MKTLTVKHVGKYFLVSATLAAMLITFNACSGGSKDTSSNNNNTSSNNKNTTSNNNNQNSNLSLADWQLKHDMCLESKGVETKRSENSFEISVDDKSVQAMDDCLKEIGNPPEREIEGSPQEKEEAIKKILKMNECLRKYGYEVDDTAAAKGMNAIPQGVLPEHLEKCSAEAGFNTTSGSAGKA